MAVSWSTPMLQLSDAHCGTAAMMALQVELQDGHDSPAGGTARAAMMAMHAGA